MKCREAEGQFADFLSEKASKALRRQIKTHLKGCKKCQGRLDLLKEEEAAPTVAHDGTDLQNSSAFPPSLPPGEESHAAPAKPAVFQKSFSPLRLTPVLIVAMTLLMIGGFYFLTRGSAGTETNSLIDQKPLLLADGPSPAAPSMEAGSNREATLTAETPASPIPKKVGNGKPHDLLPKKAGNGKPHDLSKRAREKLARKGPPLKVLLISRDLKEAIEEIESRTARSDGRVLEKKEGDLAAKFVLLIPASQYDAFFQSLQQLGLAKEISKNHPPAEGSLKIELTIE